MTFDKIAAFREMSGGDEAAFDFCTTFFDYTHTLDDLIDKDKPVPNETVIGVFLKLFSCLSSNVFWQKNQTVLMPVIHSSAMAFVASERLRQSDDIQNKLAAETLKSQYQDVFFFVAFLTGGYRLAFEADKKYRGYSFG
jgi:hypothetical protein